MILSISVGRAGQARFDLCGDGPSHSEQKSGHLGLQEVGDLGLDSPRGGVGGGRYQLSFLFLGGQWCGGGTAVGVRVCLGAIHLVDHGCSYFPQRFLEGLTHPSPCLGLLVPLPGPRCRLRHHPAAQPPRQAAGSCCHSGGTGGCRGGGGREWEAAEEEVGVFREVEGGRHPGIVHSLEGKPHHLPLPHLSASVLYLGIGCIHHGDEQVCQHNGRDEEVEGEERRPEEPVRIGR
mmetsp:Transcript_50028/g.104396  ORF Transcript_50028/g.104396 Transcript_50028/m.104396 type:complete len:234 (+) Transcript_50028:199-900(+)